MRQNRQHKASRSSLFSYITLWVRSEDQSEGLAEINSNKFLKFNYLNLNQSNCNFDLKKRFQLLFKLTNTQNVNELDYYLLEIKKKAGLEQDFFKLGVNINKDYYKIIKGLNEQRLKNNPIKISIKDIQYILKNF